MIRLDEKDTNYWKDIIQYNNKVNVDSCLVRENKLTQTKSKFNDDLYYKPKVYKPIDRFDNIEDLLSNFGKTEEDFKDEYKRYCNQTHYEYDFWNFQKWLNKELEKYYYVEKHDIYVKKNTKIHKYYTKTSKIVLVSKDDHFTHKFDYSDEMSPQEIEAMLDWYKERKIKLHTSLLKNVDTGSLRLYCLIRIVDEIGQGMIDLDALMYMAQGMFNVKPRTIKRWLLLGQGILWNIDITGDRIFLINQGRAIHKINIYLDKVKSKPVAELKLEDLCVSLQHFRSIVFRYIASFYNGKNPNVKVKDGRITIDPDYYSVSEDCIQTAGFLSRKELASVIDKTRVTSLNYEKLWAKIDKPLHGLKKIGDYKANTLSELFKYNNIIMEAGKFLVKKQDDKGNIFFRLLEQTPNIYDPIEVNCRRFLKRFYRGVLDRRLTGDFISSKKNIDN